MFYSFERTRCPVCASNGKKCKRVENAFLCPNCRSVFSEFGIIISPSIEHEKNILWC